MGGGSGVVPLMAILRHRRRTMPELPMRLVYSVRSADDVIYADELGDDAAITYTREPPPGWPGHTGRIDSALIARPRSATRVAFVCGSHGFVESADAAAAGRRLRPATGSAPSASARPAADPSRVEPRLLEVELALARARSGQISSSWPSGRSRMIVPSKPLTAQMLQGAPIAT